MHQTKPSTINHLDTKPTQCLSLDKLTELFLVKRSIPGYCRPIMFQRPANTTAADAEHINEVLNIATAENIQHEVNQLNAVPVVTVARYCTLCPLHTLPVVTVARYCTLCPLHTLPVVTVAHYCTLCPLHTLPVVTVARYCTLYPK